MPNTIFPQVTKTATNALSAKTWAPVSYTSEVGGLTLGTTKPFPQVTLQSGFNTPYLIDEIRFTAYTSVFDNSFTAATVNDIAAIVNFQLSAGQHAFSQGGFGQTAYVPMFLYAPTYSGDGQYESVFQTTTGNARVGRQFSTRRWVLPKPLFMPAGDVIVASASRHATLCSSATNITAQVTVIGRALPANTPTPATRQVPFVGYYVHAAGTAYSEANFQLQNPFTSPWYVQRLVANTRVVDSTGFGLLTGVALFESATGTTRSASVKISDSLGYKLTGSNAGGFVSLGEVASANNDAAWTFSRPLPPGENYNVAVQINGTTSFNPDVCIGLVGYRDV